MKLIDIARDKNIILDSVIILAGLFIVFNIYRIQVRNVKSLREKRDNEIKINEVLEKISYAERTFQSYKDLLNKTKDVSLVVNVVNNIARESGVKIISIRPGRQDDYPLYVKYSFDLVVSVNNYHAIGEFISKLESYSEAYFIDRFSIKPVERSQISEETEGLDVNLTLSTIVLKG